MLIIMVPLPISILLAFPKRIEKKSLKSTFNTCNLIIKFKEQKGSRINRSVPEIGSLETAQHEYNLLYPQLLHDKCQTKKNRTKDGEGAGGLFTVYFDVLRQLRN